jgi:hypothetical protein
VNNQNENQTALEESTESHIAIVGEKAISREHSIFLSNLTT